MQGVSMGRMGEVIGSGVGDFGEGIVESRYEIAARKRITPGEPA